MTTESDKRGEKGGRNRGKTGERRKFGAWRVIFAAGKVAKGESERVLILNKSRLLRPGRTGEEKKPEGKGGIEKIKFKKKTVR